MPEILHEATVRLNEQTLPWREGLTLAALLAAQGVNATQVATAVNGAFVPRTQRDVTVLQPGDTVLTFEAIVGG